MAELASGAVNSLLSVIRNEAQLLGGVKGDVQFIKEEMESMNSFLMHLARTAPPGGEHDEQVRTWMNQVRLLAQDCNNCIDLYLYRGNPDIHRLRGRLRHFICWLPWFLRNMVTQHNAAVQLRGLKERARDVGDRRQRYGVEVPAKAAALSLPFLLANAAPAPAAAEEDNEDSDPQLLEPATDHSSRPRSLFEPRTLDDFFKEKIADWVEEIEKGNPENAASVPCMVIAAPYGNDLHRPISEARKATHFLKNHVEVDILEMHMSSQPLQPLDVLYYILRDLQPQPKDVTRTRIPKTPIQKFIESVRKNSITHAKEGVVKEITTNIDAMKVQDKIEQIKSNIVQMKGGQHLLLLEGRSFMEPLSVLLMALRLMEQKSAASEQDQVRKKHEPCDNIIDTIAIDLKYLMEKEEAGAQQQVPLIDLDWTKYARIVEEVFLTTGYKSLPDKYVDARAELGGQGQILDAIIDETLEKMEKIQRKIIEKLIFKGMADKIQHHLKKEKILITLIIDEFIHVSRWKETSDALNILGCVAGTLIVTTKILQQAKEYCNPMRDPIDYSIVGHYHDMVLQNTSQKDEDRSRIFREILEECKPYEFCMKIFAHALYANPKRSNEELSKLHSTLQVPPKSMDGTAMKMFKFSYSDLPKEYKSCLLYLALFPPGSSMRRSTLIGRWVAEGLLTMEDWPTSVSQAERCFDVLINRWLIYPSDIGATGKVKRCMVGAEVHGFITRIAKKQHIVEARLSHHLARHFSIFNDLRLRGSDRINDFLRKLSESSQLSLLKVLDLEGCHCFGGKNQHFLEDICNNIILLKYLSLRGTDITQLPSEINKLHALEVLDIRNTQVPIFATKHVLLLKLKRLLAGHIDPRPRSTDISSAVHVPVKIEQMSNIEVMSTIKPQTNQNLDDIGTLWHLRKLGVVIDKDALLINLIGVISNLHECLRSLSITLPLTSYEDIISGRVLPADIQSHLTYPPMLEKLRIHGRTKKGPLLPLLAQRGDNLLTVTLSWTTLDQDDLDILAKLPILRCLQLQHIACPKRKLTLKGAFKNLKFLLIEGSNITVISFEDATTPQLEKIALSFTGYMKSLSGLDHIPKLNELELTNNSRLLSLFDTAHQLAKLTLRGTLLKQDDLQILAKKSNIRILVLLDRSYNKSQLTFNKGEFPNLNLLIVGCSLITSISFKRESAHNLEKIVWSFQVMESLTGIDHLSKLKELELNGDRVPNEVKEAIKKHINGPRCNHYKSQK